MTRGSAICDGNQMRGRGLKINCVINCGLSHYGEERTEENMSEKKQKERGV